jgi:hypothetical protein
MVDKKENNWKKGPEEEERRSGSLAQKIMIIRPWSYNIYQTNTVSFIILVPIHRYTYVCIKKLLFYVQMYDKAFS